MKTKAVVLESDIIRYTELGVVILARHPDEADFELPAGWDTINISGFSDDKRLVFTPTSKRTYYLWLDIVVNRISVMLDISPDDFISSYVLGKTFNNKNFTISTMVNTLYF